MKKNVAILTISLEVGKFYKSLLLQMFEGLIDVLCYSLEDQSLFTAADADLYVVGATSSDAFRRTLSLIPAGKHVVISNLTFLKESIDRLLTYPIGTQAMLVNLSSNMAIESISDLSRLGVTNITFTPVYPDIESIPPLELAITPGEKRFVPWWVKEIVDTGNRVFTANTLAEIALKLGFPQLLESSRFRRYFAGLAASDYSLDNLMTRTSSIESQFDILLEAMDVGILGVDIDQVIFACNRTAEEILDIRRRELLDKPAAKVLPWLPDATEKAGNETKLVRVKGTLLNFSVFPIVRHGVCSGYFAVFQRFLDEENRQNRLRIQLYAKNTSTRYTFDEIVGNSPSLCRAKDIARRMAWSDSPILLTGESGTGKEVFAHAIHHASPRRDMPFVTVNCATLSDSLLEQALFGTGETVIQGTKRGGKQGLFEYAHRGTLFLEDLESLSTRLQARLLQVFQEQEVTRLGDDRVIRIDVRIISATSCDLKALIAHGAFRRDLYYCLNVLPIHIPSLRERQEDLLTLLNQLQQKTGASFQLSSRAKEVLLSYHWDGNIRELSNLVEYLQFTGLELVEEADLPEVMRQQQSVTPASIMPSIGEPLEKHLLLLLASHNKYQSGLGRERLLALLLEQGTPATQPSVRACLHQLEADSLITVGRGRTGCRITPKGLSYLQHGQIQN